MTVIKDFLVAIQQVRFLPVDRLDKIFSTNFFFFIFSNDNFQINNNEAS